jgi:hypothetical protein
MARKSNKSQPASLPAGALDSEIAAIAAMNIDQLRALWREQHRSDPPAGLTKDLLARALTYELQERVLGGLSASTVRLFRSLRTQDPEKQRHIKIGSALIREHEGKRHEVIVIPGGFLWEGRTYESLSVIAKRITGTSWNGPRFFGLREGRQADSSSVEAARPGSGRPGRRSSINKGPTLSHSSNGRGFDEGRGS